MKVLVTGGCGFIGSHVVDELTNNDFDVVVLDLEKKNLNPKAEYIIGDIRDKNLDKKIDFNEIDVIIHHAAQINVRKSVEDPIFDCDTNVIGTVNLLEFCRKYDIDKFIFASSGGAVYGEPKYLPVNEKHPTNPLSPYGTSKLCCEEYIKLYDRLYDLDYCILRYSNVYGERQDPSGEAGVISIFIDKMLKGERPVIFGDGEQTRDFVYVEDVARANLLALNWKNEVVNIGSGKETSVNKLFEIISGVIGFDKDPIYSDPRPGEVRRIYLDVSHAKDLGWEPEIELEDGIRRVVEWLKR